MARAAKNAEKFNKLWNADDLAYLKKHYPKKNDSNSVDWNRVDQALVNLLCFWTKDDSQVLRLWKQSELNRDKLERNDYTERTIETARESQTAFYSNGFVETVDIGKHVEIPPEYAAITENTKLKERLYLIVQDAALLLDAIRLLFLYLGFTKNHSRLLNALLRKGRERLGVFHAKQSWLLDQYVNNGEKVSSEKTVGRDIHSLLEEQEKLGIEVIRYWQGFEGVPSRFQNLFLRHALEAISQAISRRREFDYFWQALEVACFETAERVPRNAVLLSEEYKKEEKESQLKRAKRDAISKGRKYLHLLLEDGRDDDEIASEAMAIHAELLRDILAISERSLGGPACPPNETLFEMKKTGEIRGENRL